ncbi:hypothetical protein CRU98_04700 [Arcobacter sp. CECT 8986]|uniref:tyrosine-type recombinase/integrase n=1 Tax=Arcobacter sp. CECT 8986 TaxID=2044507 RepID=UPI001009E2CC|nr:tyrosine-type recombinase/integrase [Arcobacter sp. CECT 8986]RXK00462.1 hypothetical protein CRU98_04700 [Arcobacter sp. CECT 8986]
MAIPKLAKTKYKGIGYYKDGLKGKVYIGTFRINGKLYRRTVGYENDEYRTTEKIAFIKKEELKEKILKGDSITKKDLAFRNIWQEYITHLRNSQYCSNKTIETKVSTYNVHYKPIFDNLNISKITNYQIQQFANNCLKTKAPKSVLNYVSDLSAFFNYAIRYKLINENPAKNIDLPKFDNERVYPLTVEESKKLFNTILNYHEELYRGVFTFLLQGRRKEEVLNITWDMIDLEKKEYTIRYEENKARKNMTYLMNDELYDILINIEDKEGYVFKSPKTKGKLENIRHAWKRIKLTAGIEKDMTIHELRHLLGYTLLNEANQTEEVTAAVLGQTTKKATKRYAKVRQNVAALGLKKAFEYLKE